MNLAQFAHRLRCLCLLSFVLALPVQAQDAVDPAPAQTRPRVALVLGGGGARGAAHIGVLEVLEKLRVPVDCVAGTSMGALVAGAYVAGNSPQGMREALGKADWNDMFQDNPTYSEINYRNKSLSRRFMPGSETGVNHKGLEYQGGVVSGQKIKLFFNRLVNSDHGERTIESLPLPLSIIATDIGNGDKVFFRDGSLSAAMRASMSVPGLMAPVSQNGHKLVDGGLVDNLPITEARALCNADTVIAVNVGSPLLKPDEVGSMVTVSVQMVNILTEQNVNQSLALLKPTDIYIKPDLEGITAGDFQKSAESSERGRLATEQLAERLKPLAVSDLEYAAWLERLRHERRSAPTVHEIEIAGLKRVSPAAVERQLRVQPGEKIDDDVLDSDMLRIYGDGWYDSVDYTLLTSRDRNILRITPYEKPWGPDYMRFGVNFDSNFKQSADYTLRAAYDKTWLNRLGGQLLGTVEMGRSSSLGLEWYQPLEEKQRYFLDSRFSLSRETMGIYLDDKKLADYRMDKRTAALGLGVNIGVLGQVRAGLRKHWLESDLSTGVPSSIFPSKFDVTYSGQYVALDLDQMDRLYFPTSGWSSKIAWFNSPGKEYSKLTADVQAAYSYSNFVVSGKLAYQGSLTGRLPIYDAATLGGFLNLGGFVTDQLRGDEMQYAGIRAERIVGRLPLGLRGDMRAGIALETAKARQIYTETDRQGWLHSATVYLGGETPLGPVYLGFGKSDSGSSSVYLFVGTP